MASSFHAVAQPGSPQPRHSRFLVDPNATFANRALVYLDVADSYIKACGSDPTLILGYAQGSAADAISGANGLPAGTINVAVLEPNQVWFMGSATTPTGAAIGVEYGIVATSGVWLVDTTETDAGDAAIIPIDYSPKTGDLGREGWFVRWKPENLQASGIET